MAGKLPSRFSYRHEGVNSSCTLNFARFRDFKIIPYDMLIQVKQAPARETNDPVKNSSFIVRQSKVDNDHENRFPKMTVGIIVDLEFHLPAKDS